MTDSAGAVAFHGTLARLAVRHLETAHGVFDAHLCENLHTREPMLALALGDVRSPEPLLARVHSSCVTSEIYGACDCDCAIQLGEALAAVARAGRGVVFYLSQEGRGAGFSAKARDRMLVQASLHRLTTFDAYDEMGLGRDQRRYDEVVAARSLLGIEASFVLLSNNPDKQAALVRLGVPIAGATRLDAPASPWSRHYLAAKFAQGHALADPATSVPCAELPEPVPVLTPRRVDGARRFLHVATYLLPVATGERPTWLRLHAHLDLETGAERVIFEHGDPRAPEVLVRVQRERWLERFAPPAGGIERRRWLASASALAGAEAGLALFLPPRPPWQDDEPLDGDEGDGDGTDRLPDDALAALLARRIEGRRARLLLAPSEGAQEPLLRERLERHGVETLPGARLAAP